MAIPNIGWIVLKAWDEVLRETPGVFDASRILDGWDGKPKHCYRYWLDRQPYNTYGNLIPRIVTVRRNLRQLGNIRLDPKRLV